MKLCVDGRAGRQSHRRGTALLFSVFLINRLRNDWQEIPDIQTEQENKKAFGCQQGSSANLIMSGDVEL